MAVSFATTSMKKKCSEEKALKKNWGENAPKLSRRLSELRAATTLQDIFDMPAARCHKLIGDRKGQLSVDLKHPFRLIIEPNHSPLPEKNDGGLDPDGVTKVVVIEVADTH